MYVIRQSCSILKGEFALMIRQLKLQLARVFNFEYDNHTIEFVNVAGTAINIHHTIPTKKSFPLPLTKLETSCPSIAATFKLIKVRITKNMLWLIKSLSSLLFHPGMQILNNRNRFLKNSLFNSTFFLFVASPFP